MPKVEVNAFAAQADEKGRISEPISKVRATIGKIQKTKTKEQKVR